MSMTPSFRYRARMARWWRNSLLLLLSVTAAACGTKSNPAATCSENGECSDPSFPFCDVDGTISGDAGSCIAVVCKTGQIGGCNSDGNALVCNADGTTFDTESCPAGCDAHAGCLACKPNESACVGTTLSTCGPDGTVASTVECQFACSADGERCTSMVPSNGLLPYLDAVVLPPDVDLENGSFNVDTGSFFPASGNGVVYPIVDGPAPAGGVPVRVLVVHDLTLNNVSISIDGLRPAGALAVMATGNVNINGRNVVSGSITAAGCDAGSGGTSTDAKHHAGGGGGGGFATSGGAGGSVTSLASGGSAGNSGGTAELIPLRGGCPGGSTQFGPGGGGGAAFQISSFGTITLHGTLVADGSHPSSPVTGDTGIFSNRGIGVGGGAGGAVLLEAPTVVIDNPGILLTRGAGGTSRDFYPAEPSDSLPFQSGGACVVNDGSCGVGGDGASPTASGHAGQTLTFDINDSRQYAAGGGGGGDGRIRINTLDGMFTRGNNSIIAGSVTTGKVILQ